MTTDRRAFLRRTAAASVAAALPAVPFSSALAQTAPTRSEFKPVPGDWRTFDVTTRVDLRMPSGATQVWLPLPSVESDWQRSLTSGFRSNGQARLAEDGRLVIIAVQGGVKAGFNAGLVLRRRLTITGSTLRPRPVAFKAAIAASLRANVWPLLEQGRVKPVIHSTFDASRAAEAHALMETNQHIGKIVLTW